MTPLAEQLAAAFTMPPDTSADVAAAHLAGLRAALADGLGTDQADELRAFASVARRFGHHADVWNATQLLAGKRTLDPHARALRAEAWLALFPEAARRRPHTVQALLDGDPEVSDQALASILTTWIRRAPIELDATTVVPAAEDLIAAHHVATSRWPTSSWLDRAPAFAAAYVEVARQVAGHVRVLTAPRLTTIAPVWATALELADATLVFEDAEPTVSEAEPKTLESSKGASIADPDVLKATATRLGEEKRRIWVVGALKAKWHDLLGLAKRIGVPPTVFAHVEYEEVKQKPMLHRINVATDVGVLIGPVPHSAGGVGSYGSLLAQLRQEAGLPVIELRANSVSKELVITKQSFKTGLLALLTDLATAFEDVPSVVAAQPLGRVDA